MDTANNNSSYTVDNVTDFDLVHIFECGQCFRWERQEDGSYTGAAQGRIVNMRYDSGRLTIAPCTEAEFRDIWRPYLDLDRDYSAIKAKLSQNDDVMKQACKYGYGIRILKQDLWETIVSFIISQNNNIPRIKGCIERLCDNFGEPINADPSQMEAGGSSGYESVNSCGEMPSCSIPSPEKLTGLSEKARCSIPSPEKLAGLSEKARCSIPSPEKLAGLSVEDLAPVRLGYRAKYLIETARTVCENGLPGDFDELSALCGVGPKVASCIALFGMQDYASFPIDVWVMKVMHELYGLPERGKKQMAEFAHEHFGELGGFAQQYLFYYMRDRS